MRKFSIKNILVWISLGFLFLLVSNLAISTCIDFDLWGPSISQSESLLCVVPYGLGFITLILSFTMGTPYAVSLIFFSHLLVSFIRLNQKIAYYYALFLILSVSLNFVYIFLFHIHIDISSFFIRMER